MRTLLILRHAKSSWDDPDLKDYDRPLNKKGLQDALLMGKFITANGLVPDLLICSPAKRAKATVAALTRNFRHSNEIIYKRDIYDEGCAAFFPILRAVATGVKNVMLVGHNPDLEAFVHLLTGKNERLPTAALAHIELPLDSWKDFTAKTKGKLVNLFKPKELW